MTSGVEKSKYCLEQIRDMFLKVRGSVSLVSGNTTEIEIELRFFSKSKIWDYFELIRQAEIELGHFLKRQPEEKFSVGFFHFDNNLHLNFFFSRLIIHLKMSKDGLFINLFRGVKLRVIIIGSKEG